MLTFLSLATASNVLLVVVDDLGVDKVSAYADDVSGYRAAATNLPDTAAMDDLAASGLRFTAAWSNPLCSPTRAGIMTGRHAWRTGVGYPLPIGEELDVDGELTLAETMSAAGYATGAFGKWHLGTTGDMGSTDWEVQDGETLERAESAHPVRAGFDVFAGSLGGELEDYWGWTYVVSEPGHTTVSTRADYGAWPVVDDAAAWINEQTGPWFAYVALNAAHTDGEAGSYEADDVDPICNEHACLDDGTCSDENRTSMRALTECGDASIAELLAAIDPALLADTVVIVVGDNGTESSVIEGEYATTGTRTTNGKATPYETGVRVPLLVADGQNYLEKLACDEAGTSCTYSAGDVTSPGRRIDNAVHTVDLFATVAGVAAASATTGTDSVSFSNCLKSTSTRCVSTSRTVYTEAYALAVDGSVSAGMVALKVQRNKLVAKYSSASQCLTYELYSLSRDPFERRNLATVSSSASTLASMKSTLSGLGVTWLSGLATCS